MNAVQEFAAEYLPIFINASVTVLWLTLWCVLWSWVCGLIAALAKVSRIRPAVLLSDFYVWFIRGTPALVQVFFVYFGLPQFGIRVSPIVAGIFALGLNSGAYVAEIVRGGLMGIPKGQRESAVALGMSNRLAMRRIILPQVVKIILPGITNEAVGMLKNTSLLSTITVLELTLVTQIVIAKTYRPFEFYAIAAALYLAMTTILTHVAARMEKRMSWRI